MNLWKGTFWSEKHSYLYFWTWVKGEFYLQFDTLVDDLTSPCRLVYTGNHNEGEKIKGTATYKNGCFKASLGDIEMHFFVHYIDEDEDLIEGKYITEDEDYGTFTLMRSCMFS